MTREEIKHLVNLIFDEASNRKNKAINEAFVYYNKWKDIAGGEQRIAKAFADYDSETTDEIIKLKLQQNA